MAHDEFKASETHAQSSGRCNGGCPCAVVVMKVPAEGTILASGASG
jgi:hypothetical protein